MPILIDAGMSEDGWSMKSRRLCPRKAALAEAGTPESEERDGLVRGSLVHVGAAHHYARVQAIQMGLDPNAFYTPEDAIDILARQEFARSREEGREHSEMWLHYAPIAKRAVEQYALEYIIERWEIIGVEQLVDMRVPGPRTGKLYRHTMRIDLIVRQHGKIILIDNKTTFRVDKKKKHGFELSGQVVAGQWWGQREYGDAYGGFMINAIQVRNEGYCGFERFYPRIAPQAVSDFPKVIEHNVEQWGTMHEWYGDDPYDYPPVLREQGPCMDRYGPCGYRRLCRLGRGIRGKD